MDLSTTYLGLDLKSPLVPSASPLSREVDTVKLLEDAGAAAVVMYSLFEEEVTMERLELHNALTQGTESFAEALTYFPEWETYDHGPEPYLEHLQKLKETVDIPIIASLNGKSLGGWTQYAQRIQEAGADALELNIYYIPTDLDEQGADVEKMYVDIVTEVKKVVSIPLAVKLSPFFSNMANMARRLEEAGADGLVLFNRFYQPDIDLENLDVMSNVLLSTPQAMRVPMRWIAILFGQVRADLAGTGGIHNAHDIIKMLMSGASITQMCSSLLMHGPKHLKVVEADIRRWMEEHEYESIKDMIGSMSQKNCPDPSAFERAQYMRAIKTYQMQI